MKKDYYQVLGVSKDATLDDIKKAFRELAKKHHPDLHAGDKASEERFKAVNEAYAVLSDTEKRKQYDAFGAEGFSQRFSQEDIFRDFDFGSLSDVLGGLGFGDGMFSRVFGGTGHPGDGRSRVQFGGAGPRGFEEFSFGPSGFQGRFSGPTPMPGQDLKTQVTISLVETLEGGRRRLSLQSASGTNAIEFKVPPGIRNGQQLRLRGKGQPGTDGGPPGDLLVEIAVAHHPTFSVEDDDLVTEVKVPLTSMVLGGMADVPALAGPVRRIKIKPGTANGTRIRVREQGLPGRKTKGDLYVVLKAQLPERLSPRQKELFKELKESGL